MNLGRLKCPQALWGGKPLEAPPHRGVLSGAPTARGLQKGSAGPTPCLVSQGSLLGAATLLTQHPPAGPWEQSKQRPR